MIESSPSRRYCWRQIASTKGLLYTSLQKDHVKSANKDQVSQQAGFVIAMMYAHNICVHRVDDIRVH